MNKRILLLLNLFMIYKVSMIYNEDDYKKMIIKKKIGACQGFGRLCKILQSMYLVKCLFFPKVAVL